MAYVVGLTGGIGSGKSTVLSMLAARGAATIDADAIVRELQRAGRPVFDLHTLGVQLYHATVGQGFAGFM